MVITASMGVISSLTSQEVIHLNAKLLVKWLFLSIVCTGDNRCSSEGLKDNLYLHKAGEGEGFFNCLWRWVCSDILKRLLSVVACSACLNEVQKLGWGGASKCRKGLDESNTNQMFPLPCQVSWLRQRDFTGFVTGGLSYVIQCRLSILSSSWIHFTLRKDMRFLGYIHNRVLSCIWNWIQKVASN